MLYAMYDMVVVCVIYHMLYFVLHVMWVISCGMNDMVCVVCDKVYGGWVILETENLLITKVTCEFLVNTVLPLICC